MSIVILAMQVLLSVIVLILIRMVWMLYVEIRSLGRKDVKMLLAVSNMIGDEHAAEVLREASRAYESIEEKQRLDFLSRTEYQPGGPSMPALWLRDRAETLAPQSYLDEVVERTLDGKVIR